MWKYGLEREESSLEISISIVDNEDAKGFINKPPSTLWTPFLNRYKYNAKELSFNREQFYITINLAWGVICSIERVFNGVLESYLKIEFFLF